MDLKLANMAILMGDLDAARGIVENAINIETITDKGELSGSGAFSEVYIMPDDKAVKVCKHANADAWLWWAIYCLENQGEDCIPNIYGVRIDYATNTYTATMDMLYEPTEVYPAEDEEGWEPSEYVNNIFHEEVAPDFSECYDMLSDIFSSAFADDLGPLSNWMIDSVDTPYVTDPIAYHGWSAMKEDTNARYNLDKIKKYLDENLPLHKIELVNFP